MEVEVEAEEEEGTSPCESRRAVSVKEEEDPVGRGRGWGCSLMTSREDRPLELLPTTPSSLISGTVGGEETDIAEVKLARIARARSASGFGSVEL